MIWEQREEFGYWRGDNDDDDVTVFVYTGKASVWMEEYGAPVKIYFYGMSREEIKSAIEEAFE